MLQELEFIVEWHKCKEKTWSGTPYSLLKALRHICTVNEINISESSNLWKRIKNRFFPIPYDFGIHLNSKRRKVLTKKYSKDKHDVIQFSEVLFNDEHINSYIYIDLSISYMNYMMENNPQLYKLTSFDFVDVKYLKLRKPIQNAYFESCSGIFTMCRWLRDDLVTRCGIDPKKVHHVGGGINLDVSGISESLKQNNKILFIGRDYVRKGLPLVYDAFVLLKETMPEIELHVAGPEINPYPNNTDGYFFYGDSSHEELSGLLNKCDVFCMPSHFEAYGLVFIEALTYGLPCIGRDVYEMPYLIEDGVTGLLVDSDDVKDLTEKIHLLLTDGTIRNNVKLRREWFIKEYSWDNVASKIFNIIASNHKS